MTPDEEIKKLKADLATEKDARKTAENALVDKNTVEAASKVSDVKFDVDKALKENPISENLKTKFKVVGVVPGLIRHKGVQYDLRDMDDATAEKLAGDKDFKYLVTS